jgi:hypothetical protein
MADPVARRLDRMLEALPRIYRLQPPDSALNQVLGRLAEALAALDRDQRRVLHARWIGLADGQHDTTPGVAAPSALEGLGGLMATPRLGTPAPGGEEPAEDYRARLRTTARALVGDPGAGMATPRAILALALADLGTEACPRMESRAAIGRDGWDQVIDATFAWGVPVGTRRRCAGCASGEPGLACPHRGAALVEAWIAENPPTERRFEAEVTPWKPFRVENYSLAPDRPRIELAPLPGCNLAYPALQNEATGEILLYAGVLSGKQTLVIHPEVEPALLGAFDTFDAAEHHAWLRRAARGRAEVVAPPAMPAAVDEDLFVISGSLFDQVDRSLFGGSGEAEGAARFTDMRRAARPPLLRPGIESWRLLEIGNPEARFDDPASVFAGPAERPSDTRFALWDGGVHAADAEHTAQLFRALNEAERNATEAPDVAPRARLSLTWLTRPPACFRLGVMRSPQVDLAASRGALDLLRRDLDLARPAGVQAQLEIRQPKLPRDAVEAQDRPPSLSVTLGLREVALMPEDRAPAIAVGWGAPTPEDAAPADRAPVWDWVLDVTRLDASRLPEEWER